MPKRSYALKKDGPKEIECSWGIAWKNFTVKQNGQVIGTVQSQKELKEGREFQLSDSSKLFVKLKIGFTSGLFLTRDGQPLPGSDSDPVSKVKGSFAILMIIAIINIVIGVLSTLFNLKEVGLEFGLGYIVFGFVFLILSLAVRRASLTALIIAIIMLILDAILGIIFLVESGGNQSIFWIIARVFFLIYLLTSVSAFKKLKNVNAYG
jgi:hypothetical protein